jgi:putative SOS response-associated peptidase YedK
MCGRFADHVEWSRNWVELLGEWPEEVVPSYNRAPSEKIAAFTSEGGFAMRWGLIPSWSKEPTTKYSTFNARIENIDTKPAYRSAWRANRRCVIPARGYYEWMKQGNRKLPYFIHDATGIPLFLAGLWEYWKRDDASVLSCTVLTQDAVPDIASIHNRMPVLLTVEEVEAWLQQTAINSVAWVADRPSPPLEWNPVSTYVNNARNDGEACITPLTSEA